MAVITPRAWLLLLAPVACFDGDATRGLPCQDDQSCGPGVSCKNGWCGGQPLDAEEGGSSEASDGGGQTVTVSGTVQTAYFDGSVLRPGVRVSLYDDPDVFAITDADGAFVLAGVPAGAPAYLVAAESAEFYGTIFGVDVMFVDLVMGQPIIQVSELSFQTILDQLLVQDPTLVVDDEAGLVVTASTTLDVTVQLQPMPLANGYFALDANGMAVLGSSTIAYFWLPIAVFFNLAPGAAGAYEVTAAHATSTCVAPLESPATLARHLSLVEIICG